MVKAAHENILTTKISRSTVHKCTYVLRKCLSHTAQSEGTSQSCDIIVSMQHAHLHECSKLCGVCVIGGMQ